MPDVTLVPVDHEPDFGGVSFVPVDHNPFSADDMIAQARTQLASQPDRMPRYDTSHDAAAMQPETFANPYVKGLIDNAASLPRRAIENSQRSLDTGDYDPGPTLEAATLPMGTGAVAGVPVRAGEAVLGAGPIRAYHGSPHDFDAFSLDKIGTGEGAQAYGHGLYFAENEGVAKSYRDALAARNQRPAVINDGGPFGDVPILEQDPTRPGRMYEVNINADPEHFLDWDRAANEQHPVVQKALNDLGAAPVPGGTRTGADVYEWYGDNKAKVSAALREAGIPGIKYLDQGSRAAGDGSRNYVVFNDKLIDIVRKYAAAGIALPPAIAGEYAQQFKPVDHDPFAEPQPTPAASYMTGLR